MRILLDLDEVLADFVNPFCEMFGQPNPYDTGECKTYGFIANYWKLDPELAWSHCTREFWARLPKLSWADEVVRLCARAGPICVVSAPPECNIGAAVEGKMDWMRQHYPYLPCFFGRDKSALATRDALLVDDCNDNCFAFDRAGGISCIFPRPWNVSYGLDPIQTLKERLMCLPGSPSVSSSRQLCISS